MQFQKEEKQFMALTAGFFFLLGPFQTIGLLATGWGIDWEAQWAGQLKVRQLPYFQILDNFVGGPALWFLTCVGFMAWRRGHIDEAVEQLALAFNEGFRKKSVFDES